MGHQQVQGIDYAYTLQGWLKGVNSDSLLDNDGKPGGIVTKDAYRFSLNYFNGDYNAISYSMFNAFPGHTGYMPDQAEYKPLYNGNISSMVVGIPKLGETQLYNYGYDQLNRIISMDRWKGYDAGQPTRTFYNKLFGYPSQADGQPTRTFYNKLFGYPSQADKFRLWL